MQIINSEVLSEFQVFLDSISDNTKPNSLYPIGSFSIQISHLEISTILNSNINKISDFFYWKIKNEKLEFLAIGKLYSVNEFGEDRLKNTGRIINKISENYATNWIENDLNSVPLVVGGIKFAPNQKSELWNDFSDSDWFIPNYLLYKQNDKTYLIYNFFFDSPKDEIIRVFSERILSLQAEIEIHSDQKEFVKIQRPIYSNSLDQWETIVNKALSKISHGLLSKVVLSREVRLELENRPLISELVDSLSHSYPNCYTFAFKRENSIFFGASPEKLAKISDRWIEVDALAGSAPRGKTVEEDLKNEIELLNSKKNLFEQRAVVNFIHNLLSKFSSEVIFDDKPIVRKLPNIQHLWTILKAKVDNRFKMFDLLVKLHPTPAICGDPWKIAQDFILEMEPHDRGLYSGNIGWFNFDGSGEFAVGIRSALVKDNTLFMYAGCGIVEGSEASAEFAESEIKLKPILSLFVDEKVYQS